MAAGLHPERIAENWQACRRYLRAWKRAGLIVAALLGGGLSYVQGGRDALKECPPVAAPPPSPHIRN